MTYPTLEHDKWPTLSQVALYIRAGSPAKSCTREDIADAAYYRNVPIVDGRVPRIEVPALFFGVQA